jgi:hypothetical protein
MDPTQLRIRQILEQQDRMLGYGGELIGGMPIGGNPIKGRHYAKMKSSASHSPWIAYLKRIARNTGESYAQVLKNKEVAAYYRENKAQIIQDQMRGEGSFVGGYPKMGRRYPLMEFAAERRARSKSGKKELARARLMHSYDAMRRRR